MLEKHCGGSAKDSEGGCTTPISAHTLLASAVCVQFVLLMSGGAWAYFEIAALKNGQGGWKLCSPCEVGLGVESSSGDTGSLSRRTEENPVTTNDRKKRANQLLESLTSSHSATDLLTQDSAPRRQRRTHEREAFLSSSLHNAAHFIVNNDSVDAGDFTHDVETSITEEALVYTELFSQRRGDLWYPRIGHYIFRNTEGRVKYFTKANWMSESSVIDINADSEIYVRENGTFLIYAQVGFYESGPDLGYIIKKKLKLSRKLHTIAACQTYRQNRVPIQRGLNTCSVTTIERMNTDEKLVLQVTPNRRVCLRADLTYIGLVKLA